MTPGTEPALTPDEWLSGVNRGKAMTHSPAGICGSVLAVGGAPKEAPAQPLLCPQTPS